MKLKLLVIICSILQSIAGVESSNRADGHPSLSPRIIGGRFATKGEFPYMCSLQTDSRHVCGCVIISKAWVVTAAKCYDFVAYVPAKANVLVGTNDRESGGTRYKIDVFIPHQQFQGHPRFIYDIALVRVVGFITFNENVQPIRYSPITVPSTLSLRVTGWGEERDGPPPSRYLKVLNGKAITGEECRRVLPNGSYMYPHDSHLCIYRIGGHGACDGDMGGPLVVNNWLVGIASWKVGCTSDWPYGFTRISHAYDWIQKIRSLCSEDDIQDNTVYKTASSAFTASAYNHAFYEFVLGIHVISRVLVTIKF